MGVHKTMEEEKENKEPIRSFINGVELMRCFNEETKCDENTTGNDQKMVYWMWVFQYKPQPVRQTYTRKRTASLDRLVSRHMKIGSCRGRG